jgi:sugar transferase (PEP-CTERM/EpsH1 system associated)
LKILMLAPSLPFPPHWAAGIRRYEILRHLSTRHDVSLLTYVEADEAANIGALTELGVAVYTVRAPEMSKRSRRMAQLASLLSMSSYESRSMFSRAMQRELDRLVRSCAFDVVIVETCHMGRFDVGPDAVSVLDEHNIEYELLYRGFLTEGRPARRLFNLIESMKIRLEERAAWRRSDGCLVHSNREREILLRSASGKPTAVVTNGVHLDEFRPDNDPPDLNAIVFTGAMNYRPNTDAVLFFVREVLPLILHAKPKAKFYAVGVGPSEELMRLAGPNVVITGRVPDVKPFLHMASVYVAPIRFGSGTRIKVVEALAVGKPVVSTTLGCEGHDSMRPGVHFLAADDAATFAREVLRVLDDRTLAFELGSAGRQLVEREYSWPRLLDEMERFLVAAVARPVRVERRQESARGVG